MRAPWRKVLFAIAAVAAFVGLISLFRHGIGAGFSWTRLRQAVAQARVSYLLISCAAMYVAYAMRALRWKQFCRSLGPCRFQDVYSATLMGYAGLFLFGRAGEPLRPVLLARKCLFSVSSMFGIWLLERLFDLAATVTLLGLSLMLPSHLVLGAGGMAWEAKFRAIGGVLIAGLVGLAAIVVYFRLHGAALLDSGIAKWRVRGGWRARFAAQCAGFSGGLRAIGTWQDLVAAIVYSALHWGIVAFVYLLIAWSFGGRLGELDFQGAMLVLIFTMVGSAVQLPGVGGGTQVLSFIAFTQIFGVAQEPAAAVSIVLWLITFAVVCPAGIPLLIREGWSMGELRKLARTENEAEKTGRHVSALDSQPDKAIPGPDAAQ